MRLRELRKLNKISAANLAEILNVSDQTIYNWETGESEPDIEMITKLGLYFKVTADYLMEIENVNSMDLLKSEFEDLSREEIQDFINDLIELLFLKDRKKLKEKNNDIK